MPVPTTLLKCTPLAAELPAPSHEPRNPITALARNKKQMSKHHNDGQKHGTKRKYNPPHQKSIIEVIIFGPGYNKRERADRDAYNQGYRQAKKQR